MGQGLKRILGEKVAELLGCFHASEMKAQHVPAFRQTGCILMMPRIRVQMDLDQSGEPGIVTMTCFYAVRRFFITQVLSPATADTLPKPNACLESGDSSAKPFESPLEMHRMLQPFCKDSSLECLTANSFEARQQTWASLVRSQSSTQQQLCWLRWPVLQRLPLPRCP